MEPWVHGLPDGIFFTRLAIATVLGLAIGFERQWRQRTAGLHTMTLVAVGAALFCAIPGLGGKVSDPWRVAAQVVTGVGFLAGGVILRQGLDVRGITTAATLWATAAVGALVGSGFELQGGRGGRRRCRQRLRAAAGERYFADSSPGGGELHNHIRPTRDVRGARAKVGTRMYYRRRRKNIAHAARTEHICPERWFR